MAGQNFVVQNGLTVGPLTIDAATGSISTTGTVSLEGGLAVSTITKNDSSIAINDTGTGSSIVFTLDGTVEHTMTGTLTTLNGNVVLNDVGYLQVPAGTSAQRPGSPVNGMMRYNSSITSFEGYYAGAWSSLGGVKSVDGYTYIQAETSAGASNDELEFFTANASNNTTRISKFVKDRVELNGNLFLSPVTNGVNTAYSWNTTAALTDSIFVGYKSVNAFAQAAIHNNSNGGSASTDFIAYADSGTNTQGYIDMGIASSGFNDPAFGSTKAGDSYIFASAPSGTGGNLVLATENGTFGDIVFAADGFTAGTEQGRFKTNDGLYLTGNLVATGGAIYQGPSAKAFEASGSLTNPTAIFTDSVNGFAQVALHNNTSGISSSADLIAYADTGNNIRGYIDMGICSTLFADDAFGVTHGGDGYVFVSAPAYSGNAAATGGNLVLATADGAFGDIVFAAGGFIDGTEQGRFVNSDGLYVTGNIYTTGGELFQGPDAPGLLTSSNVTTTLTSTINASVTTIPVVSTTSFPASGSFHIQSETIYYTGKTSNSFTGATRGTSGTTAASHTSGYNVWQSVAGLTGTSAVLSNNANGFTQLALKNINSGTSASTDLICYSSNGDNDSGWIDVGITSENYNDATYGITGPNTGYIFMSAPDGTTGYGSLFLSTSDNGTRNDIVFSTNGFGAGTERVRIIGKDRAGAAAGVVVNIATTATSTTTGALRVTGGVGLQGNLYVGGNFNLQGNITIGGTGSTTSTSTLVVENPINFLANANTGDSQDIGIVGQYTSGTVKYTGVARDNITKSWRFFDGLATKPTTTIAFGSSTAANVYMGSALIANSTAATTTTSGAFQVVGGVGIGGAAYVGGALNVSGTSTVVAVTASGLVKPSANATVDLGATSAYWNNMYAAGITTNGITVGGGGILPAANIAINIGSTSSWFNTFYGISTQAKYADLAENYQADAQYEPGTVVEFGGAEEVTVATEGTKRVAGVVSTNPAHLMNGGLSGKNVVALALQGRVPCKVIGPVQKGDLMVSAGFGYAKTNNDAVTGQVIGKALADFSGAKGQIEVVVGRV